MEGSTRNGAIFVASRKMIACHDPSCPFSICVRLAESLSRFHECFVLKRLPYVAHERNCLHLGEQRGTADVFKAHRKHPFRSIDGHRVEHVSAPVKGEVSFVALYDVLDRELHPEITRADIVPVRLLAKQCAVKGAGLQRVELAPGLR